MGVLQIAVEPQILSWGWWKGKRGGRPLILPQGVLPQNFGRTELNRTITSMVFKATANDRCHLAPCHDEFHGHESDRDQVVHEYTNKDIWNQSQYGTAVGKAYVRQRVSGTVALSLSLDRLQMLQWQGLSELKATRVPLLTARYKALRLAWARKHRYWTVDDCKQAAWSDESRFELN
ncbi:hypothetical protein TNCV_5104991 [Trichonephila clavipes]|nr:hypothetical protein TNCV_5104991 [Trichonephila clavipes]